MQVGLCVEEAQKEPKGGCRQNTLGSQEQAIWSNPWHFINEETEAREGLGRLEATFSRQPQRSNFTPS